MINHYPLWKNSLLVIILLLGFIFAVPNIFGEDPAVQVTPTNGVKATTDLAAKITTALSAAQLSAKSSLQTNDTLQLRFADTDTELKARDVIKTLLGDDYIVAVNIAPATPRWLTALGAQPMRLGLDLRGGVHFALQVDTQAVIAQRMQGSVKTISAALRAANLRYAGVLQQQANIMIAFREAATAEAALRLLRTQFPELQFTQQTTPAGDYQLLGTWSAQGLAKLQQTVIDQTMTTLRNRVNELGVAEPIVQQQGVDRIAVDLPGIQDTARAQQILGGTATLDFRLVDTSRDPRSLVNGTTAFGASVYDYNGRPVLLKDQVVLTGSAITDAAASFGEDGRAAVNITLGGGGESYFHRVTGENVGKALAIVYVETRMQARIVNGQTVRLPKKIERVISVATIQSALPGNFQITGLGDPQEARTLSLLLRAGALPAPIYIVEERTIGPQLGAENIHKGVISISVGFLIAVIFMGLYYGMFGIIANVALAVNLVLQIALLSMLGMTLTLPGMAGIVLTVGMAVDANVLIFERIREELRNGNSPQASIFAGYERAFATIVDANVATLIAALVLFGIGTGAVKGFAITLSLGLVTSMLTSLMFARAIINAAYGRHTMKKLPVGI